MSQAQPLANRLLRTARSVFDLLVATYGNWRDDRAIRLGAGLAYYALFALVPLFASAIGIAGLVFSESDIRSYIAERLSSGLNDEIAGAIELLAGSIHTSSTGGSLTLLGVVSGLFAASLVFAALQDSLNMIWDIPVKVGIRQSLRRRLLSFAVVFIAGGLLIASLAVQTVVFVVEKLIPDNIEAFNALEETLATVATWGLGIVALAVIFQILVHKQLDWRDVLVASALTGVLLVIGTWALGVYFRVWGSVSVSGVAGGLLIILIWLFYEAQILVAGAELLKTLDQRADSSGTREATGSAGG